MNKIHPTAFIGPAVHLGIGNVIGPSVVITGNTVIGDGNWIGPGSCLGLDGDILGLPVSGSSPFWEVGSETAEFGVIIGDENVLKEHVTIHAGSHRHTEIGDSCYLMPRAHLGHDCWLGDNVLLSPGAQVAGHVSIGSKTVVGMGALIHQFSNIGPLAMVGMGCCVRGNVEVCRTVIGEPHKVSGINKVGIKRLLGEDLLPQVIDALKNMVSISELPEPLRQMTTEWYSHIVQKH